MYVSKEQVEAVVRVLKENEYRLFDSNVVLREVAVEAISKVNDVIYYGGL